MGNDDLKNRGYEYIEFYFLGYLIKNFIDDFLNKTDDIDNSIVKEELRNLIRKRLGNYSTNLNRRAIEKEYEELTFGEAMLEGIIGGGLEGRMQKRFFE